MSGLAGWKRFAVGVAMLQAGVICAAPAADWGIEQLMHGLAQSRSGHARYVEEKSIAMLEAPVTSSGELYYRAPDHLERRTLTPQVETMVIDGDALVIERQGQSFQVRLSDYPELAAFIQSVRGTLAGDRDALEKDYHLSVEGDAGDWVLQLLPRAESMQAVIWRIRISGQYGRVTRVEITQPDGDRSVMRIEENATP